MTPSALKSALAKLREPTLWAPVTTGTPVHVLAPDEAAALLAKIEAADRLAKAAATDSAFCEEHGGCCMEGTVRALAAYRNPAPAAEGE